MLALTHPLFTVCKLHGADAILPGKSHNLSAGTGALQLFCLLTDRKDRQKDMAPPRAVRACCWGDKGQTTISVSPQRQERHTLNLESGIRRGELQCLKYKPFERKPRSQ